MATATIKDKGVNWKGYIPGQGQGRARVAKWSRQKGSRGCLAITVAINNTTASSS